MAESPIVPHAEILDRKQCWSEIVIAPSLGLRLIRMSTRWKCNFINFLIELCFCICSVLDVGAIHEEEAATRWWWQDGGGEHGVNKEKMGQRFHNTCMMKFRS
jgi:hypothetical protein